MRDSFEDQVVSFIAPHSAASKAMMNGMDFLNGAAAQYPAAISLAAGRPADRFAQADCVAPLLAKFVEMRAKGGDEQGIWRLIGQYSQTGGIINDLIRAYLQEDEQILVDPDGIFLTNGFQEALLIHLLDLSARGGAVVCLDPSYVGLAGAAEIAGAPLFTVSGGSPVDALFRGAQAARAAGFDQLALYVVPDYPNPGGLSLSVAERRRLLDMALEFDMIVLEDTAYRVFWYEDRPAPTLLSLDTSNLVRQLGTFSKMFLPGIRVGFSAQKTSNADSPVNQVAIKSFASVATSPVAQAVVGGFLMACDFKVQDWNADRRAYYKRNCGLMDEALTAAFKDRPEIAWRRPAGGFFFTVELPFDVTMASVVEIAEDFGVLVVPMTLFSPSGGSRRQVRLSFSNVEPDLIPQAVQAFSRYVETRLAEGGPR